MHLSIFFIPILPFFFTSLSPSCTFLHSLSLFHFLSSSPVSQSFSPLYLSHLLSTAYFSIFFSFSLFVTRFLHPPISSSSLLPYNFHLTHFLHAPTRSFSPGPDLLLCSLRSGEDMSPSFPLVRHSPISH